MCMLDHFIKIASCQSVGPPCSHGPLSNEALSEHSHLMFRLVVCIATDPISIGFLITKDRMF